MIVFRAIQKTVIKKFARIRKKCRRTQEGDVVCVHVALCTLWHCTQLRSVHVALCTFPTGFVPLGYVTSFCNCQSFDIWGQSALRPAWNGQMCRFGIGGKGDNFDKGALFSRSVGRGSICLTCRKQLTGTGSNSAVAFLLKHLRGQMISPRKKDTKISKSNNYSHRYIDNDKNNTQHGLNAMALSLYLSWWKAS